jgi:hypothetical protein
MSDLTACPGCGTQLPRSGWSVDRTMNASPECWQILGEISGFQLSHPALNKFQQLTVDAYGAQHAGGATPLIRVAYSLVGLHLALDRGANDLQVRTAHQRMGRPDPSWPNFRRPETGLDDVTVLDVAEDGVRSGSISGHERCVLEWANAVWRAWWPEHLAVQALTRRLLLDQGGYLPPL